MNARVDFKTVPAVYISPSIMKGFSHIAHTNFDKRRETEKKRYKIDWQLIVFSSNHLFLF